MTKPFDLSRRSFLTSLGRFAALGTLLAGTARLSLRKPSSQNPASCRRQFACDSCAILADCQLPPAQQQRFSRLSQQGSRS